MTNKKEAVVIMYDSPEAATLKTVTGWVSADGRFFGSDEHMARWSGCTHKVCECGNTFSKLYTICETCRAKNKRKRYAEMPFKEWDRSTPVAAHGGDEYFFAPDEIEDYCNEHECNASDLQLVICIPNKLWEVSSEIWQDIAPEDEGDFLPKEVELAIKELNKVIGNAKPVSWQEGSFRTSYEYTFAPESE